MGKQQQQQQQQRDKKTGGGKQNAGRSSCASLLLLVVVPLAVASAAVLVNPEVVPFLASLVFGGGSRGPAEPTTVSAHASARVTSHPLFAKHENSMLWGTYRPQAYFGIRARTPESVVGGMLWVGNGQLRHYCSQDDKLVYAWDHHDGKAFGSQTIKDGEMTITTTFHKDVQASDKHGGHWSASMAMDDATGPLLFYIHNEDTRGTLHSVKNAPVPTLSGSNSRLGRFQISFRLHDGSGDDSDAALREALNLASFSLYTPGIEHLAHNLTNLLQSESFSGNGYSEWGANVHVVAVWPLKRPLPAHFSLSVCYVSLDDAAARLGTDATQTASTPAICNVGTEKARRAAALASFDKRFERTFRLQEKGYSSAEQNFAKLALSNLVGGMGYWYGHSFVRDMAAEDERAAAEKRLKREGKLKGALSTVPIVKEYFDAPLFSAVPSRSFFPRGFMWDEGFHQLLVSEWDPSLTVESLGHWLDLMNAFGWIPREQILNNEARAKVPMEFVVQPSTNANPPAWFLAFERLLSRLDVEKDTEEAEEVISFLEAAYPRLQAWFEWFNSQKGVEPTSYRWRGRQNKANMMNALTLTSGLDDYPRASKPSRTERHLDLRCWMAEASSVLFRISTVIGKANNEYNNLYSRLTNLSTLNSLHWSNVTKAYHDYGPHQIEDSITPLKRCVRDVFGYVSLFPMLLEQLPAESDELGMLLKDISDPEKLWTPYGLRSLSKSSPYYQQFNTRHDPPYWRGAIWININYLAVKSLHHYSSLDGPHRALAKKLYVELRRNLISNIFTQYESTGFIWEQYDDSTGAGKGSHPFTGWSALVVLLMAEKY